MEELPPLVQAARAERMHGLDPASIRHDFIARLYNTQAKFPGVSTTHDHYQALAFAIRDRVLERWIASAHTYLGRASRTVAYLSAEYLLGPQLGQNILALGAEPATREALTGLGLDLDVLLRHEVEPALGNGGLGRLAACFMDSLAALDLPAIGYGIRYEFGIFEQGIKDGGQIERTDGWLRLGCPWAVARPEISFPVGFGGHTQFEPKADGGFRVRWIPARTVMGTPHDIPVLGYRSANANFLRLWQAQAPESFDFQAFNVGDYLRAVHEKIVSENITKVLYPNDDSPQGKRLRLEQQYFFVSCTLQDMIRLYRQRIPTLDQFHEKFAAQLNDTHPSIAIAELMRLLIDVYGMAWAPAWEITRQTFSYTNHTLLPEALETWPLELFASVLPRHLEIIYEINRLFLDQVRTRFPGDEGRVQRMSLIDERGGRRVRMAHLATVGSHTVNGVAALHSRLLKETVLKDFAELWPNKIINVTNGVTPRRFMRLCNPTLSSLLDEAVGEAWPKDLSLLHKLEPLASDRAFQDKWSQVKLGNKRRLLHHLSPVGLSFDPDALLDVQVKRIHEYKRQHLNLLHAIALYARIGDGKLPQTPRTLLFAGKAAPGYYMAKLIIRLAHAVGDRIAAHPLAKKWLRIVFVPNFNVKNGEQIYPAADLSEQISTAGMEASGTGNMKLSLNGALTVGTLDGANVEIRDAVGAENFYLFGLDAEEVSARKARGYRPREAIERSPELGRVLDLLGKGHFGDFGPLLSNLWDHDPFLVLADYDAYAAVQQRIERDWLDRSNWARRSIQTVARMASFSSDRAIQEYASKVWRTQSVRVQLG